MQYCYLNIKLLSNKIRYNKIDIRRDNMSKKIELYCLKIDKKAYFSLSPKMLTIEKEELSWHFVG